MSKELRIADLGDLEGEVILFGGCYSNLQATHALLAEAAKRNIGQKNLICTGDVVGYCADPEATVQAIVSSGCSVVAGNVERQLAQNADDCGCGFDEGSTCDRLSAGWYAYAADAISLNSRNWMKSLPDMAAFRHNDRRFLVLHGGATDIARFLWPASSKAAFREEWDLIQKLAGPVDCVISGHSGIAFEYITGPMHWMNAGVIGMPPNDDRAQTRYCRLSDDGFHIERLNYDFESAANAMERAGLTQGYDQSLRTGIWPSEDNLPPEMRR